MAEWPSSASRMRSKSSHKVSLRYRCSGVLRADPAHRNASAIASPRMNPRLLRPGTHLGGWGRVSDSGAAICVACWWLAALPASLNPNSLLSWEKYREIHQFWPPTSEFPFEITGKISSLHDEFPALCNRQ